MLQITFENLLSDLPLLLLFLILTWALWEYFSIPKNYPPGPWGLPFVGYSPFLGSKPHITLAKLRKKYGDVYSLHVPNIRSVVLCSYKAQYEAFVKNADSFSARSSDLLPFLEQYPGGVIFNNGASWTAHRRFALSTLRNFGFGKSSLQQTIMEEAHIMNDIIKANEGKPMALAELLQKGVTNVICTLITGHRNDYDYPVINELIQLTRDTTAQFGLGKIETLLPLPLQRINILKYFGFKTLAATMKGMRDIMANAVVRYSKKHRPESQDSFIDCYLTEIEKKGNDPTFFTVKELPYLLRDLFIAGSDTTTNSLAWAFLYMAKHQEIQKKIQAEIDDVIGRDRSPDLEDQKKMPFTEATLMEVTRIVTIIPLSVPHCTSKDTTLYGYFIPKNTFIIQNLHAVHHDPHTFPEPEKFKPERFLTDQQQIKKMDQLIPFSIGKRQCLGESLARMELFLFFTAILQHFSVKPEDGVPLDFDYKFGGVSIPKSQKLRLIPR